MSDVFISYSRKESKDLVERIAHALEDAGLEVWVDTEDIPPTSEWLAEIYAAIEGAADFVFVISPGSLESEICGWELSHAIEHSKRLVPILHREADWDDSRLALAGDDWAALKRIQWIDFTEQASMSSAIEELADAITTDLDYVRMRSGLYSQALDWDRRGRKNSDTLRGDKLKQASEWLTDADENGKEPPPTDLHREFLRECRKAFRTRRAVSAMLVALTLLGILAFGAQTLFLQPDRTQISRARATAGAEATSRSQAEHAVATEAAGRATQQALAEFHGALASSREFAVLANQAFQDGNIIQAYQLAVRAWKTYPSGEAEAALYTVLQNPLPQRVLDIGSNRATSVQYSPDGSQLLIITGDGPMQAWDVGSGSQVAQVADDGSSAAFSPDGTQILTDSGNLWDVESNRLVLQLPSSGQMTVTPSNFSPDGTRIITADFDTAGVWDAETGRKVAVFEGHEGAGITSADFNSIGGGGQRVLTGDSSGVARVWNVERLSEPEEVIALDSHGGRVASVIYMPGENSVLTTTDNTIHRWQLDSGEELMRIGDLDGPRYWNVAFGGTGGSWRAATSSGFTNIASPAAHVDVWNSDGEVIATLEGHTGTINSIDISADGEYIVTASADGTARVWDSSFGAHLGEQLFILTGHSNEVLAAKFDPDRSHVVTTSSDGTAMVWNLDQRQEIVVLRDEMFGGRSAVFSPDGTRILTASTDHTARVWDAHTGEQLLILRGHSGPLFSANYSPDGTKIVTAGEDGTARVWDAYTGTQLMLLQTISNELVSASFSPDGTYIVSIGETGSTWLWNAEAGTEVASLGGFSASFSPDASMIVTGRSGVAEIWDTARGTKLLDLDGHSNNIHHVAFSPDGTRIVTGSLGNPVHVWDAESGELLYQVEGQVDPVINAAVFSPDGASLVTAGGDGTARVWDVESGLLVSTLDSATAYIRSASFSPDSSRLAAGSNDGTTRVWDVESGKLLSVHRGHDGAVFDVNFSPDGARIVTVSRDGARVWAVGSNELVRIAEEGLATLGINVVLP